MEEKKISNEALFAKIEAMESNSALHRVYTRETLENIKEQTTKTNGRMIKAEEAIDGIQLWRAKWLGVYIALTIVGIILAAIGGMLASYYAGGPQKPSIEINNQVPQSTPKP